MLHGGDGSKSSSRYRRRVTKRQAALQFLSSISLEGVSSYLRNDPEKSAIFQLSDDSPCSSTTAGLHMSPFSYPPVSPKSPLSPSPFFSEQNGSGAATTGPVDSVSWSKTRTSSEVKFSNTNLSARDEFSELRNVPPEALGQLRCQVQSRSPNPSTPVHELLRASSISEHNHEHPANTLIRSVSDAACHSPESNKKKIQKIRKLGDRHLKDSRIVLVTQHSVPFYIFSFIPYLKGAQLQVTRPEVAAEFTNRSRYLSGSGKTMSHFNSAEGLPTYLEGVELGTDCVTISYSQYLIPYSQQMAYKKFTMSPGTPSDVSSADLSPPVVPTSPTRTQKFLLRQAVMSPLTAGDDEGADMVPPVSSLPLYDPDILDDPELMAGKHRTVLRFKSYLFSVTDYTKPSELKRDINEQFHEKFPNIQLTLSKIRSIKKEMRKVGIDQCGLDVVTVAQSYVYFEKLILMQIINKPNRKLCSAACLLLASKMNDVKGADLKQLIDTIIDTFRISHRELIAVEFPVLVALEFSLLLPESEVLPHYKRLLHQT